MISASRFALVLVGWTVLCLDHAVPRGPDRTSQEGLHATALDTLERAVPRGVSEWPEVERICEKLRSGPPSEFEREWMLAAGALFSGRAWLGDTQLARRHFDHALVRFPGEPHLQLARLLVQPEGYTVSNRPRLSRDALAHSQGLGRRSIGGPVVAPLGFYPVDPRAIPHTLSELERLSHGTAVANEAHAHLAMLRFILGDVAGSLEAAGSVSRDAQPFDRNLAGVVTGLALDASARRHDATEAYAEAVRALPEAKSSATALAVHLFLDERRIEAASAIHIAYSAGADLLDPWFCPVPDDRLLPDALRRLKKLISGQAAVPSSVELVASRAGGPSMPEQRIGNRPETSTQPAAAGQATFRRDVAAVAVEVSVRASKSPVRGLAPSDFEVLDTGVVQRVQSLSIGDVPLDVTLILDTSESASRPIPPKGPTSTNIQAAFDVRRIASLLRPADRLRVLEANIRPRELLPLVQSDMANMGAVVPSKYGITANFPTAALYDAVAAALVEHTDPDRRSMVFVFTDGMDGTSVITADILLAVARESDVVLNVARHDTDGEWQQSRNPRSLNDDSRHLLWPVDTAVIENVARLTGGTARHMGDNESSVERVEQMLDEFRQSYIIHYQPIGVTPGGWHPITVKITRSGKFEVHARRGYFGG
jgi:VWFA-related protein